MDETKYIKLTMNPTRQRILQIILYKKKASTSEIAHELSDIPIATLYRNIKLLRENDIIEVVEQKAIRGVIENYYSATKVNLCKEASNQQTNKILQACIYEVSKKFNDYFKQTDANPVVDKLGISSVTLLLSDEEMEEFYSKLGKIINEYSSNQSNKERKSRTIMFISLPNKGE